MFDDIHRWYYDTKVWTTTTWLGVPAMKSVQDMWSYQEIITELQPGLVVEFGVAAGGATLFYAGILDQLGHGRVLGVDVDLSQVHRQAADHPRVVLIEGSSTEPAVADRVVEMRAGAGPIFAVLDSDHHKSHVLAELELLTPLLEPGDYLIVEDSNISGHPVLPDWGPGPFEAITEFLAAHPGVYRQDTERETKFGWTFAPEGFLVRI